MSSPDLIVRAIEKSEISQLAKWNVQLHEDELSTPMSVDGASKRFQRWLADQTFEGVTFVAEGEAIGYLLYERRPVHRDQRGGPSLYIRQFFIARGWRRRGRGTAAFKAFCEEHVSGDTRVVLDVKVSNPAGQRFWESLGFRSGSISYERDGRKS